MPETQLHMELRSLLYELLVDYLGLEFTVGSEQFVYYAADDPHQSVAPDAFVRLEPRGERIRSWKTWERGAPEVAAEIVSDSDAPEPSVQDKLARYRRLGVRELVRFDPQAPAGSRLRVWDRVEGDLVERQVAGERAASQVLSLVWVVAAADDHEAALRVAEPEGGLVLTRTEARQAAEADRQAAEAARESESHARKAAEARVAALEAELGRRGGG
ncbi:MAG: Uma2 family endonuclease [Polyangiaceae bacterium]|nr:Uma2 family endonuclease [Polyangiaceae bacterium]